MVPLRNRVVRVALPSSLAMVVLMATGMFLLLPMPCASALSTVGRLDARPLDTIAGEPLDFVGRVTPRRHRPVALQRRRDGAWVTLARGRTSSTGRFRFAGTTPPTTRRFRVLAPRTRIGGRRYAAVQTPHRRVSPVPQQAALTMPAGTVTDQATTATATFTPARPGRLVVLERRSGGEWQQVLSRAQDSEGRADFTLQHPDPGTYRYRAVAVAANGAAAVSSSEKEIQVTSTVDLAPFVTRVSANGRYFEDQNGQPILVKGDSPWAILQNSSTASMDRYLETRADQGFNMVLVSLLGNVSNGAPSNDGATHDGVLPFVGGAPSQLNDAYWQRVDHFLTKAASLGISVMAYPLDGWVGTSIHDGLAQDWSASTARAYGEAVGSRLESHPNVIWAVGGDYDLPTDPAVDARFDGVLTGLAAAGADRPATIQFQPNLCSTEADYWDDKVDFNFVYSYLRTYVMVERGYAEETTGSGQPLPALMGETHYEGYEAGWEVDDLYLRQMAAWSLTSGSPGEFYGAYGVWDDDPTQQVLETTAVRQLQALRGAFESLDGWHLLVPDFDGSFITAGRGTKASPYQGEYTGGDTYVTGAVTPDGTLGVVYLPDAGRTITLDTARLASGYAARWVDPTNGASVPASTGPQFTRSTANAAGGEDWLLVLESPR